LNKWLNCEITKGMFSDELTVRVRDAAGASIAVFVPRNKVSEERRAVSVRAIQTEDKIFAVLPDERHTSISVPVADLQQA
jgi:hypothetical protein